VAHEINNPIAVMQGNLDLLREELGEAAAPVANEVRLLDEQIHRVRVIVTKLLQFARPDEFAGYVETVDVNTAVADCLVLVRHELKKGDIEVVQELHAAAPVHINRNELQQVLINLAVNAVHAMAGGGRLTFVTENWENKGVRIGVRDTGAGIPPEHLARVFDPFFTTKKTQGTGLGLSISLALIERYGGTISVESRLGEGTEFSVFLLTEPVFREQESLDKMANT
jgi:two-component system NtrC family sensor kinase